MAKTLRINGKPIKGWSAMVMRAATRNFPWKDIAAELIDNALANVRDGEPCRVAIAWDSKLGELLVTDHGRGCDDIEAFFRPGKTGGNHSPHGNSTFGTGLFAIECYLDGHLQVATERAGRIHVGRRTISDGVLAEGEEHRAKDALRAGYGLPRDGGTVVRFRAFRKRVPSASEVERIATQLGMSYAAALEAGDLVLTLDLNGHVKHVRPADRPKLQELHTASIAWEGHEFTAEWGVTEAPVHEPGCRLIYGGKTFDITARPCGTGRLGRFYAALRIPRSAGQAAMDLLKNSAEMEYLEPVFHRCHKLFEPQLAEADRLCGDDVNRLLSDSISHLLSRPMRPKSGKSPTTAEAAMPPRPLPPPEDESDADRPPRRRRAPYKIVVDWLGFGAPVPLARYDFKARRLTYNLDNQTLARLRAESRAYELAWVASSYIAYEIDKLDPQLRLDFEGSLYDEIYRELIERAVVHFASPGA